MAALLVAKPILADTLGRQRRVRYRRPSLIGSPKFDRYFQAGLEGLERIPFRWNRNSLLFSFSGRIFCGEPVPT
ncbi:MAG: hypothetical protein WB822_17555, partial [Rhodoplanes sp.]